MVSSFSSSMNFPAATVVAALRGAALLLLLRLMNGLRV
jgi:hypothetical protein